MFDSPFDFFALLIAVVAFIFARKALNQAATLRARLDAIEAAWQARPVAPPLTPLQEFEQTLAAASPGIAAEQPADGRQPNRSRRSRKINRPYGKPPPPPARPRCRRRFRNPSPASRSASAPAGWSGSAA